VPIVFVLQMESVRKKKHRHVAKRIFVGTAIFRFRGSLIAPWGSYVWPGQGAEMEEFTGNQKNLT